MKKVVLQKQMKDVAVLDDENGKSKVIK